MRQISFPGLPNILRKAKSIQARIPIFIDMSRFVSVYVTVNIGPITTKCIGLIQKMGNLEMLALTGLQNKEAVSNPLLVRWLFPVYGDACDESIKFL